MTMEKQIEEMAKDLCDHYGSSGCDSDNCECYRYCNVWHDCSTLIEKGYRKASDLVNEIFADVFVAIRKYYIEAEHTKSITCELMLDDLKGDLAELKKKYTETEETDDNTKITGDTPER